MAVVLEAVCGWFWFLGVGHIVRGYRKAGIALMLIWWMVLAAFLLLGVFTLGGALACLLPVWFATRVLSAVALLARDRGGISPTEAAWESDSGRIECPECGHDNRPVRHWCKRCRAPLPRSQWSDASRGG